MGKKIAIVLNTEPEWGGSHQYASILAECMIKMDQIELVAVCCSRYWLRWCRKQGIRTVNVPWPSFTQNAKELHIRHSVFSRIYTTYMTEFGKWLKREKIDAVLCTSQADFVPNFGIKVIAPVHDLMHRYEGRFQEVGKEHELREKIFSSKAKYAWCVLTDSKVGKQQFIESYSKYIKKSRTRIISLPFVVSKHIMECEEEFIEAPTRYVFYPAQFWQHKNHMNLVKAIELLMADISDIHLLLVGSEKNSLKDVKRYILKHGLEEHITIKGFVSNGNITYLYKHAVGLIMPTYFGPTNIPPLEAMALGCPVAVSNKYAMPEQVGDAGLLFNPDSPKEIAECIRKIWLDEDLRQSMIQEGYLKIRGWNLKAFNRKFQKVIRKLP